MTRLVRLECPTCGARFTREKYVACWRGDSEQALERELRRILTRLGLSCNACQRPVREFLAIYDEPTAS
jgi:hypothetical protein